MNTNLIFILFSLFVFQLSATNGLAKMVSISGDKVNLRSGPSTQSQVKWLVGSGFPLKVIARKGKWYKVRDFENDTGWVYAPLTSGKGHMVVKKNLVNIRRGPGMTYSVIARAKYGVTFRTIEQIRGWSKIRHQNGTTGWISRKLLWGW